MRHHFYALAFVSHGTFFFDDGKIHTPRCHGRKWCRRGKGEDVMSEIVG
jgi:hypothetical protein